MTFSKKMQVAGYYTKKDLMPAAAYRVFNTWMGDPARMLMLEAGAYTRPLFSST